MLRFEENISLKPFNTFGVEAFTKFFYEVIDLEKLKLLFKSAPELPIRILGGGSNILFTKNFDGLTLLMATKGIKVLEEKNNKVRVEVQAGENWHEFVLWCLKQNYGGVENLALIPGSVGAAPLQNIGAYGVELSSVFYSCKVINLHTLEEEILDKKACEFDYRSSLFKTHQKGKYLICAVTFELQKKPHQPVLSYAGLKSRFENKNPTIQQVAEAVIEIRQSKLPDPKLLGNGGSFFKNPVVKESVYKALKLKFTTLPCYPSGKGQVKIPAAWLIDYLGYKGRQFGQAGVHQNQALVLVNLGEAKGSEILKLAENIQKEVKSYFGITLEMEVNIL